MSQNTSNAAAILKPEEVEDLIVRPLMEESVALQAASVVRTGSKSTRFPIVTGRPAAAWTLEAEEIDIVEATFTEIEVTPSKLAAITPISSELAADSDPSATKEVGRLIVADLKAKLDDAFFAATTANGPAGLGSVAATVTYAGETISDTDPFVEAISKAEALGVNIGQLNLVGNPTDVLAVARVKRAVDSNEPLLGVDASSPTKRSIAGVPLWSSSHAPAGTFWLIPRDRVFAVVRNDFELTVDSSVFFTSDRIAVRAKVRVGFGFPHPAAVGAIVLDEAS